MCAGGIDVEALDFPNPWPRFARLEQNGTFAKRGFALGSTTGHVEKRGSEMLRASPRRLGAFWVRGGGMRSRHRRA
jgi:hypothetical protein